MSDAREFHACCDRVAVWLWDVDIYETNVALLASYRLNISGWAARRFAKRRMRQAAHGYYEKKRHRDHFTLTRPVVSSTPREASE